MKAYGLGDRFLGHIERCGVLLHLVDGTAADVAGAYRTIRGELEAYDAGLPDKPEIVALNKCDALDDATIKARTAAWRKRAASGSSRYRASPGNGVTPILRALLAAIDQDRGRAAAEAAEQANRRRRRGRRERSRAVRQAAGHQDRLGAAGRRGQRRSSPRLARRAGR